MRENEILDQTLEILSDEGAAAAYAYLESAIKEMTALSGQTYNFLYCLAAVGGRTEEALDWLHKAIITKGMWYRPEVFDDEDLDSIRTDKRFMALCATSKKRYQEAQTKTQTICTWKTQSAEELLLVLHGNQQNIDICRKAWDVLNSPVCQVEYLQSREPDSYGLYRWEADGDGPQQLAYALEDINSDGYRRMIIGGFSAGCNTILRGITEEKICCDTVLLQSPWIPEFTTRLPDMVSALKSNVKEILILCARDDADCFPGASALADALQTVGAAVTYEWSEGRHHGYTTNFTTSIRKFLS